jgi:serine/threonine protein kinase
MHERANPPPDIKPLNIFLTEGIEDQWPAFELPVLGNFGLYKILDADKIVAKVGTTGFVAPEQCGPYPSTPLRTDVFLIGWTIYCLMRRKKRGATFYKEEPPLDLKSFLAEDDKRLGYVASTHTGGGTW